jgi:hypothetical protein
MMIAHRRTLTAAGALLAALAFPADAFGCWSLCVDKFGYNFGANGTFYELTSCTQTWPDGSNNVHTVCKYSNVRML